MSATVPPGWTLAFTPAPGVEDFRVLFAALDAATAERAGPSGLRPVAILLRDGADTTVGGLWGRLVYAWLIVEMLVVPRAWRGRGVGTSVMREAEAAARRLGCIGMEVSTLDIEAPGFYERLGFVRYATLPDCPPGHACIHLFKRLD